METILHYSIVSIVSLSILLGYLYAIYDGIKSIIRIYRSSSKISIRIIRSNTIMAKEMCINNSPKECEISKLNNSEGEDEYAGKKLHYNTPRRSRNPSSANILELEV